MSELTFELEGNKVAENARVERPSNPQFAAHMEARDFKTFPVASYIPALQSNRGGTLDLSLDGQGNVGRLEDALYRGTRQPSKKLNLNPMVFSNPWYWMAMFNGQGRMFGSPTADWCRKKHGRFDGRFLCRTGTENRIEAGR